MLQDVTRCYKMLQKVTRCNKMLQKVTRCNKMLQKVTRCYKMRQDATGCYKKLQDATRKRSPFPLQFLNPNNTTFFFDYNQIALTLLNLNLEVYATFSQV